jgi:YesN/AraC family two-component response regulator
MTTPSFVMRSAKLLGSDDEIKIIGEAHNGAECVKKLGELKPDILLLDLRMPDKNGLAVLEEVNFDDASDSRHRPHRRRR